MAKEKKVEVVETAVPSIGGPVVPVNVDPQAVVVGEKPARPDDRLEVNPVVIPAPAQPVAEKGKK